MSAPLIAVFSLLACGFALGGGNYFAAVAFFLSALGWFRVDDSPKLPTVGNDGER